MEEDDKEVIQANVGVPVQVVEGEGVGTIALKEEEGVVEGKVHDN